jgi:hypothetical protein
MYIRFKVVGSFSRPYVRGNYVHRATLAKTLRACLDGFFKKSFEAILWSSQNTMVLKTLWCFVVTNFTVA